MLVFDTLCSVLTWNLPQWLPILQTFLTGNTHIPVAFLQLCINVINKNINSYNFPLVTICTADNTQCELAKIANFTCVKSDDCVQAVLDGNADLAVAKADEMATHGKFRVLLIVTEYIGKCQQVVCI